MPIKRSSFERFVDVFDADPEINRLHAQLLELQRAWPLPGNAPAHVHDEMTRLHDLIDARAAALRGFATTKNPGGIQ